MSIFSMIIPLPQRRFEIEIEKDSESINELIQQLEDEVPSIFGIRGWLSKSRKKGGFWVRLNEIHKFGFLPSIFVIEVEQKDQNIVVRGDIKYSSFAKLCVYFWFMLFGIVSISFLGLYLYDGIFGDNLIPATVNGVESTIRVFPTAFISLLFMLAFIAGYPTIIIYLGWKKTNKLLKNLIVFHLQREKYL